MSLLSQIDEIDGECTETKEQIVKAKDMLDSLCRAQQDAQDQSHQDLAKLEQDKASLVDSIPAPTFEQFRRVSENYEGQAMAAVILTDRRNSAYSCSGCYMSITIDTVDGLMTRDEIKPCSNCQRLLYFLPEEK